MKQILRNTLAILGMCAAASAAQASEGNYFFLKGELYRGANLVSVFSAPLETKGHFELSTRSAFDSAISNSSESSTADDSLAPGRQEANYHFYVELKESAGSSASVGLGVQVREGFRQQSIRTGEYANLRQTVDLNMSTGLFLWRDVPVELPLGACAEGEGDDGCYRILLEMSSGSVPRAAKKVVAKK